MAFRQPGYGRIGYSLMHSSRIASFFLGLWLGSALLVAWVSRENLRVVDRTLASPNPAAVPALRSLGAGARPLFRYQASEQNRILMETWGSSQLVAGIALFFFLLFATREGKLSLLLGLLMIAAVVMQRFLLIPEIASLGRTLDFVADTLREADDNRLRVLDGGYFLAEAVKWGLGLVLLASMGRRSGSSRNVRKDLDLVNKPDYRHVNR